QDAERTGRTLQGGGEERLDAGGLQARRFAPGLPGALDLEDVVQQEGRLVPEEALDQGAGEREASFRACAVEGKGGGRLAGPVEQQQGRSLGGNRLQEQLEETVRQGLGGPQRVQGVADPQ